MRGSGIYSDEFDYEPFTCENEECEKFNATPVAYVDDWNNYTVECEFCGVEYTSGNVNDDAEQAAADAMYDAWAESQLD